MKARKEKVPKILLMSARGKIELGGVRPPRKTEDVRGNVSTPRKGTEVEVRTSSG